MELIRLLLKQVEGEQPRPDLSGYSEKQQVYHYTLLIEAKLVDGEVINDSTGQPASTVAWKLTWSGHEFLDAARNDTVWQKVTGKIKTSGISVTFDIMKTLLVEAIKDQFKKP